MSPLPLKMPVNRPFSAEDYNIRLAWIVLRRRAKKKVNRAANFYG